MQCVPQGGAFHAVLNRSLDFGEVQVEAGGGLTQGELPATAAVTCLGRPSGRISRPSVAS